ncbi:MAG: M4 family metallopeptidase [Deltaproteobacteria bacterium]|nr:M4 family metallopeptidase [Deltaproteobacteria bacterium]
MSGIIFRLRQIFSGSAAFYVIATFMASTVASTIATSANADQFKQIRSPKTNEVIAIQNVLTRNDSTAVPTQTSPFSQAQIFLDKHAAELGAPGPYQKLTPRGGKRDRRGMLHLRYNQTYSDVPIFGSGVTVHLHPDLNVSSASGKILQKISLNPRPRITPKKALRLAKIRWHQKYHSTGVQARRPLLYVFNQGSLLHQASTRNFLVWEVQIFRRRSPENMYYYIDAKRGRVVQELSGAQNLKRRVWDCGTDTGQYCYLDKSTTVYSKPIVLGRSEGKPLRPLHPKIDKASGSNQTNLVYDMLGKTYNYFKYTFGRKGCNPQGGIGIVGDVDFPANTTSAVTYLNYYSSHDYSKLCPTAFFDGHGALWFCTEIVALDIVGHEYTHALNHYAISDSYGFPSGLKYQGESGALNEAFSDIFAIAIKNYAGSNNWLIGDQTRLAAQLPGRALRNLSNPTAYKNRLGYMPDRFHSDLVWCNDSEDFGGVHHNMSIPSYAAYLMAMGGQFNGCNIEAIGRTKQEAIFFYTLTNGYLLPTSNFNHAYGALVTACGDLYGVNSHTCKQVTKALKAVEMDQPGKCSGLPGTRPDCEAVDKSTDPPQPDLRSPSISIFSPRSGKKARGRKIIRFSNDETSNPHCAVIKGRWTPCKNGVTRLRNLRGWKRIKIGKRFTLYVRDIDQAGNIGSALQKRIKKIGR